MGTTHTLTLKVTDEEVAQLRSMIEEARRSVSRYDDDWDGDEPEGILRDGVYDITDTLTAALHDQVDGGPDAPYDATHEVLDGVLETVQAELTTAALHGLIRDGDSCCADYMYKLGDSDNQLSLWLTSRGAVPHGRGNLFRGWQFAAQLERSEIPIAEVEERTVTNRLQLRTAVLDAIALTQV